MTADKKPQAVKKQVYYCQVDGCAAKLSNCKAYCIRYRVCQSHLAAPCVLIGGVESRFCQQCGRFQELVEFDGTKRSCRTRLQHHNTIRQQRRKEAATAQLLASTVLDLPRNSRPSAARQPGTFGSMFASPPASPEHTPVYEDYGSHAPATSTAAAAAAAAAAGGGGSSGGGSSGFRSGAAGEAAGVKGASYRVSFGSSRWTAATATEFFMSKASQQAWEKQQQQQQPWQQHAKQEAGSAGAELMPQHLQQQYDTQWQQQQQQQQQQHQQQQQPGLSPAPQHAQHSSGQWPAAFGSMLDLLQLPAGMDCAAQQGLVVGESAKAAAGSGASTPHSNSAGASAATGYLATDSSPSSSLSQGRFQGGGWEDAAQPGLSCRAESGPIAPPPPAAAATDRAAGTDSLCVPSCEPGGLRIDSSTSATHSNGSSTSCWVPSAGLVSAPAMLQAAPAQHSSSRMPLPQLALPLQQPFPCWTISPRQRSDAAGSVRLGLVAGARLCSPMVTSAHQAAGGPAQGFAARAGGPASTAQLAGVQAVHLRQASNTCVSSSPFSHAAVQAALTPAHAERSGSSPAAGMMGLFDPSNASLGGDMQHAAAGQQDGTHRVAGGPSHDMPCSGLIPSLLTTWSSTTSLDRLLNTPVMQPWRSPTGGGAADAAGAAAAAPSAALESPGQVLGRLHAAGAGAGMVVDDDDDMRESLAAAAAAVAAAAEVLIRGADRVPVADISITCSTGGQLHQWMSEPASRMHMQGCSGSRASAQPASSCGMAAGAGMQDEGVRCRTAVSWEGSAQGKHAVSSGYGQSTIPSHAQASTEQQPAAQRGCGMLVSAAAAPAPAAADGSLAPNTAGCLAAPQAVTAGPAAAAAGGAAHGPAPGAATGAAAPWITLGPACTHGLIKHEHDTEGHVAHLMRWAAGGADIMDILADDSL